VRFWSNLERNISKRGSQHKTKVQKSKSYNETPKIEFCLTTSIRGASMYQTVNFLHHERVPLQEDMSEGSPPPVPGAEGEVRKRKKKGSRRKRTSSSTRSSGRSKTLPRPKNTDASSSRGKIDSMSTSLVEVGPFACFVKVLVDVMKRYTQILCCDKHSVKCLFQLTLYKARFPEGSTRLVNVCLPPFLVCTIPYTFWRCLCLFS